jgi:hypothetical protein
VEADLERFEDESVTPPALPEALQRLLVRRVAPLQYDGLLYGANGPASDPPSSPFVRVERLSPLPPRLRAMPILDDDDMAVAAAAVQGELSPRLREELRERDIEVVDDASPTEWDGWSAALEDRAS